MYSQEWRNVLEIAYYGTMYEWVLAIAVGLVGGIANSVIFGGGFKLPGTVENEDGETIYDPGFVGAIFITHLTHELEIAANPVTLEKLLERL